MAGLVILVLASVSFGLFKSPPKASLVLPVKDSSIHAKDSAIRAHKKDSQVIKKKPVAIIKDTAKLDTSKHVIKKPVIAHKKKVHKKRKKFLGIF